MNNRKGITLIELIMALALLSMIILVSFNILSFGSMVQKKSVSETEIQGSLRLISEHINKTIRFATKVHTIPRSSFQYSEDGVRDPNSNYIGVTKNGNVVIDLLGDEVDDPREVEYIIKKQKDIDYEITFNPKHDKIIDKILPFSIKAIKDGKTISEITSEVEVLNALNIEDLGSENDPAVAIAYSILDPVKQKRIGISPDAYVSMVIDVSGSMDWGMDGKSDKSTSRLTILKEKATIMVDKLASMGFNIHISIVPFSNNANNPKNFKNVKIASDLEELAGEIDKLTASGATNTGDGMRRGYYQLKNKTEGLDQTKISQHMMILVDGGTNYDTREILERRRPTIFGIPIGPYRVHFSQLAKEDKNTNNNIVVGNYYENSVSENNNNYTKFIGGNLIKNYTYEDDGEIKQAINTFVIGFSNDTNDHGSLQSIGESTNAKEFENDDGSVTPYIIAKDGIDLEFALEEFGKQILNDLWMITRPQLWITE